MTKDDINLIHALIDAYFEGQTSVEEERLLRRLLQSNRLPSDDPEIEYARAVAGIGPALKTATLRNDRVRYDRRPIMTWIAGSIAAAACLTLILLPHKNEADIAVVYSMGREIHNVDYALATMKSQLAEANMAADAETDNALMLLKEFGKSWNN